MPRLLDQQPTISACIVEPSFTMSGALAAQLPPRRQLASFLWMTLSPGLHVPVLVGTSHICTALLRYCGGIPGHPAPGTSGVQAPGRSRGIPGPPAGPGAPGGPLSSCWRTPWLFAGGFGWGLGPLGSRVVFGVRRDVGFCAGGFAGQRAGWASPSQTWVTAL